MEKHERVRLLLVDGEDTITGRAGRISHGAATLVGRWPGYIVSAISFIIFIVSVITLLMVLIFLLLIKEERRMMESSGPVFPRKTNERSFKLNNDFCREMTSESVNEKQGLANVAVFNSRANVFYLRTKPLNRRSACAVESLLKSATDKNVFLIAFAKYELDYENVLMQKYSNLLLTNVDGVRYLRGTPFQWDAKDYNKSMIVAGLLTVWQFGGTVLSDNLISTRQRLQLGEDDKDGWCTVDYELLSCTGQCAAFVYDFMNALMEYNRQDGAAPVIDKSIHDFCGKSVEECDGARRARYICDTLSPTHTCQFVRLDNLLENEYNMTAVREYCPLSYSHAQSIELTSTTSSKTTKKSRLKQRQGRTTTTEKEETSTPVDGSTPAAAASSAHTLTTDKNKK